MLCYTRPTRPYRCCWAQSRPCHQARNHSSSHCRAPPLWLSRRRTTLQPWTRPSAITQAPLPLSSTMLPSLHPTSLICIKQWTREKGANHKPRDTSSNLNLLFVSLIPYLLPISYSSNETMWLREIANIKWEHPIQGHLPVTYIQTIQSPAFTHPRLWAMSQPKRWLMVQNKGRGEIHLH